MSEFYSKYKPVLLFPLMWIPLFFFFWVISDVEGSLVYDVKPGSQLEWMETRWLYLGLMIGSVLFPFLLSFDRKVHFWRKWGPLAKATVIVAFFFLIWDMVFTAMGVWGFNDRYYLGWTMVGLPFEEWMWFFIIPYCCLFIYECLIQYIKKDPLLSIEKWISYTLVMLFFGIGIWKFGHTYTAITFYSAALITLFHVKYRPAAERSRFYMAWIVSLIPFYLVNGVLTGGYTEEPIVVYSSTEFIGFRLGTIPMDDAVYLYVFLMWLVYLFEIFKEHAPKVVALSQK